MIIKFFINLYVNSTFCFSQILHLTIPVAKKGALRALSEFQYAAKVGRARTRSWNAFSLGYYYMKRSSPAAAFVVSMSSHK